MAESETIIETEQDSDGVFKPVTVIRKVRKQRKSEKANIVSLELHQSGDDKVTELIRGFDVGMQIFNRLSKAIREGK